MNTQDIPQNWDFFFCNVEGKPSSIRLNLDLKKNAPISSHQHLLWIGIPMLNPTQEGLSSDEEYPVLCDIEDALAELIESKNGIPAGTLKTDGKLELFFYLSGTEEIISLCEEEIKRFSGYEIYTNISQEVEWGTYFNFLFPDDYSYKCMQNRRVCYHLEEQGYNAEMQREIDHWIYFSTQENSQNFVGEVEKLGYKTLSNERLEEETSHPFQVHIARVDNVILDNVNENVWRLVEIANRFDGIYDGWGCNITK